VEGVQVPAGRSSTADSNVPNISGLAGGEGTGDLAGEGGEWTVSGGSSSRGRSTLGGVAGVMDGVAGCELSALDAGDWDRSLDSEVAFLPIGKDSYDEVSHGFAMSAG
jgi:hypothetical protein